MADVYINTILLNESKHIVSIAAILASKCPTYGYPPSLFWEASEAKIGKKSLIGEKTLRRNAVKNISVFAFCGMLPWIFEFVGI